MPGRTEAVDAEMLALACHYQGTPPNQTGAKQRCDRDVIAFVTKRKAIAGIRDKVRRKAAVTRVAGEQRTVAKVLPAAPAIAAFAASVSEPGNPDALSDPERGYTLAERFDPADHLVAGNDGVVYVRQFAVDDMQIGPADATSIDPDPHIAGAGCRILPFLQLKRRAGRRQNHGLHCVAVLHRRPTISRRRNKSLTLVKESGRRPPRVAPSSG